MRKFLCFALIIGLALSATGCFSPMVYQESKQKVALRKAVLSNNEAAIKAIKLGDDGVGVGINVLALEALKEQPLKQAAAAVGDALLIWGGYEGVKWAADSWGGDGDDNGDQDSGRDSNRITVNGDGNDIHVGDETTTTTGE
jgi:hypothetical protein